MPTARGAFQKLRLELLAGPPLVGPIEMAKDHTVLGRSLECQVPLPHETVSRRHAAVTHHAGQWFIADQGSRHGTLLNGVPLEPNAPAAVEDGDLIALGPWTFRVDLGQRTAAATSIVVNTIAKPSTHRVERVPDRELQWTAQQRLDLLIRASAAIHAAPDEAKLCEIALETARAGSAYVRAAWLRPVGTGQGGDAAIEVVASQTPPGENATSFQFSQSLIREAAAGQLARLTEDRMPANYGQSIATLGIHSALCAPIALGSSVVAYLYLDAREHESSVEAHAAGFCQALAQICGMALANLRREELERRQRRLEAELASAREAQQMIMPPAEGGFPGIVYAMRNTPGRAVAGDLLDVVPLGEDRVAVCLGDVSGKSIGAGLIMASTQAYLHAALHRYGDAAEALTALNTYLQGRCSTDRFVTMWVGVFDTRQRTLVHVDAGHGLIALKRRGAPPTRLHCSGGGIPLAIDAGAAYASDHLALEPGDRIVVYSDGISEQRSPAGEQFGVSRVLDCIAADTDPQKDIDHLFTMVERFANTRFWDDDATAVSVQLRV